MFYKRIYFRISRQNSSMEGNEVGVFIKALDWIPLFFLKIKIKQNPGYLNEQYNAIFKHIHQNIRAYPRSKKICTDQLLWKYYCLFRRVRAKRDVGEQVWFVPNTFGGSEGQCHLRKIWLFLPSFRLGNSIPSTYSQVSNRFPPRLLIFRKFSS